MMTLWVLVFVVTAWAGAPDGIDLRAFAVQQDCLEAKDALEHGVYPMGHAVEPGHYECREEPNGYHGVRFYTYGDGNR